MVLLTGAAAAGFTRILFVSWIRLHRNFALREDITGDYLDDVVYDFILTHFKKEKELARKEIFLQEEMDKLKFQLRDNDWLSYTLDVIEEYYVRILADQKCPIEEISANLADKYRQDNACPFSRAGFCFSKATVPQAVLSS